MTALQALKERDSEALMDAFDDVGQASASSAMILPNQSPADCRWFLHQVMTPDQLDMTLMAVGDVCQHLARQMDLELGRDYSLEYCHGTPTMVLHNQCCEAFYAKFPKERHSILRFYLHVHRD